VPALDGAHPRWQVMHRRRCSAAGGAAGSPPADQPLCLERTEVSNDRFAAFVAATGYVEVAERQLSVEQFPELKASERAQGSLVFQPVSGSRPIEELSWWHWVPGADWRHPEGPGSDRAGRGQHPLVQVTGDLRGRRGLRPLGRRVPAQRSPVGNRGPRWPEGSRLRLGQHLEPPQRQHLAGPVPRSNSAEDGYGGTAPFASFPANG